MTALHDQATRDAAVTVFDRNVVVTAGAGTGKTSLLVERLLMLFLTGTAALEEAAAITFSKKAAAEMKERLAAALGEVADAADPERRTPPEKHGEAERALARLRGLGLDDATILARARALLDGLDGATLGTIHSFAADLLRRHPFEAGLSPDFTADEGRERVRLVEELWPRFLREELGPGGKRRDAWRVVLTEFPLDEMEDLLHALLEEPRAVERLLAEGYVEPPPDPALAAELQGRFTRVNAEIAEVPDGNMREAMAYSLELLDAALAENWDRFFALAKEPRPGAYWTNDKGYSERKFPDKARRDAVAAHNLEVRELLKRLRKREQRDLAGLFALLRLFVRRYEDEAARIGLVGMDELLLRARTLLRDHPAVRREEARRARYLLVDEFQDTDPLQYEILFYLAAREPVDAAVDPYRLPLEDGRLFIVGDPKQSIYRFRGADITAYQDAVARIAAEPGGPLPLTVNFRSRDGVLAPINALFEAWMRADGEARGAEIDYEAIQAFHCSADGARVELWSCRGSGPGAEAGRRAEAAAVAAGVRRWLDGEGRHGESGKPRRAKDVALLFRGLSDVPLYVRALRDRGVDVVVDGGKSFAERPEFTEALALLRAVANPADPVAFLAALRSSLGGLDDPAVAAFARGGGRFTWRQDPAAMDGAHPGVARTVRTLRALHDGLERTPLDRWFVALLTEGDFAIAQAAYYDGAQRTANLRKLAGRAAELALRRGLGLEATADALEEEYAGEMAIRAEGESPLADESVDAVRILSIHKAKGLEFDVVFVPDLNRKPRGGVDGCKVRLVGGPDERRLAVRTRGAANAAMLAFDDEEARHREAEEKRLFYVAMTRAAERLILVNSGVSRLSGWVKALAAHWGYAIDAKDDAGPFLSGDSLLDGAVLHCVIEPAGDAAPRGESPREGLAALVRTFLERRAGAGAAVRDPYRAPSADHKAEVADERADEAMILAREAAKLVGTCVHRALERWDFGSTGTVRRALEEAVLAEAPEQLRDDVLREAAVVLEGFLSSPLPGELAAAEIVGREVPVLFRDDEGRTVRGYADLLYRMDGALRVADYKTDRVRGAAEEAAQRYEAQLHDYADCVRRAMDLSEPPLREVLFLRTGTRVVLR